MARIQYYTNTFSSVYLYVHAHGLKDRKTQKELLCIQDLILSMAIERVRAAEAVGSEILHFPAVEADVLNFYNQQKACQRCGQHGHTGATCRQKKIHKLPCVQEVRPSEFNMLVQPTAGAC